MSVYTVDTTVSLFGKIFCQYNLWCRYTKGRVSECLCTLSGGLRGSVYTVHQICPLLCTQPAVGAASYTPLSFPPSLPASHPACLPPCLPACLFPCLPDCLPPSLPDCLPPSLPDCLPSSLYWYTDLVSYASCIIARSKACVKINTLLYNYICLNLPVECVYISLELHQQTFDPARLSGGQMVE